MNKFLLIELACLLIFVLLVFIFFAGILPFLPASWQEAIILGMKSSDEAFKSGLESFIKFTDPFMQLMPLLFRILFSIIIGLLISFLILGLSRTLVSIFLKQKAESPGLLNIAFLLSSLAIAYFIVSSSPVQSAIIWLVKLQIQHL